ncbi:MAG: PAS domain S-box protein [Ignavibacteriales bacterium]|nr:PAS domain S-box protein [Ignavibacteriales bacterium]
MATRRFSTGLPKLDNYIGGLLPGDALLTFVSQNAHGNDLISSIIGYASASHIPLLYISLDDCYKREIGQYSKLKYINISPTLKPPTIVKTVKRFLSKYARDGYLITDDLSSWKKYLHSDRKVNDLYTVLTAFAEQRRIVLACTASRGAFSRETLANLKDVSTICLDFIRYGGNEYCVPLSLRGRYISHGILPLRFQLYELTSPVRENPSSEVELSSLLTEKQSKELDALLMNDERKYLQIFHGSAEAMVLFDLDGDYREINKQMETILGYSSAEFRLIPPTSIVLPSERIRFLRKIVELQRRKRGFITLTVAKKNGKHLPIEFHASNISDDLYLGILHDITESQQREMALLQREEEYQRLVEGLPFPIIVSHNRKILFVNSAFFKMFGYSKDDGMGVWAINDLLTPESMRTYQKTLRERTSFVEPFTFEVHCLRRDGTVFESELTLTDIPFRGKKCLHHSLVDISTTKGLVEKLTASEERYRTLVETSSQPVTIIREGKFIFANKAFYELFGFETDQQVIDHDISLVVADDERERFAETMRKRLSSKGLSTIEFGGVRTDGKNITIELVLHPVQEHESPVLLGFYYDRTTDQQIKRELHQRTSEMALLKEVLPALQSSLDAHRLEQAAMHRIMDVLSWASGGIYTIDEKSKQFVLGYHRNMSDVLVRKLSSMSVDEGIGGYLYKTLEPRVFSTDHYPSYLPHRSSFRDAGFQKVCFLPLVSHEKLVGLIILGAKKDTPALASESVDLLTAIGNYLGNALATAKAHREISESEKKKHRLIDSSPNVLYIALPTGSFVSVNAGIERLVGYSPKDFSRNPSLWLKVVHPDDKKILLERTTQLHGLGERSVTEYRVLPKGKALYRWVQDVVSIVRDDSGNVTELLGEICDITEQKVLIDQLRDESVLHTNILFSVPEGVVVFDRSLKCLKWNNAMENITSIREEDVLGKDVVKSLPGVDGQEFEQMIRTVMRGEVVTSRDLPYTVSGTKNVGYLWGRFSPLHNAEGNITGIIGVFTDISARKSL